MLAVHVGQADIGHHQGKGFVRVAQHLQRLFGIFGLHHLVTQFIEHIHHQHAHDGVVFDDQKRVIIGHGRIL
ncbi:hypothetical protein D3C77_799570 [compost metagenome]